MFLMVPTSQVTHGHFCRRQREALRFNSTVPDKSHSGVFVHACGCGTTRMQPERKKKNKKKNKKNPKQTLVHHAAIVSNNSTSLQTEGKAQFV